MKLLSFIVIFTMISCTSTPLTPEEQHEQEDALIIEEEHFWIKYDRCLARGGAVVFDSLGRIRRPTMKGKRPDLSIWEMRSATCGIAE